MYSKKSTMKSIENYSQQIERLKKKIENADAIIIGAGAGFSTSAGLTYSGERFEKNFADFIAEYGFHDMYTAGFYPFTSLEAHWAYWSRHINLNRYIQPVGQPYFDLLNLIKDKNYFVITTNVDHFFQKAGFDKQRLFYTQGDYGLWQCSQPCHNKTYDNEEAVKRMVNEQKNLHIPSELVPYCPVCKKPMTMNLRCDNTFVQDKGWEEANNRYKSFLESNNESHILFLELGVGENTPVIIKYPFWRMTFQNKNAVYAYVNTGDVVAPQEIINRSIYINEDIGKVLEDL